MGLVPERETTVPTWVHPSFDTRMRGLALRGTTEETDLIRKVEGGEVRREILPPPVYYFDHIQG